MGVIPESVCALLDRNTIVHLATLNEDGSPHASAIWIARDGEVLRFSTAEGRVKLRNLRRDPRLALSFVHPDDPGHGFTLRGHAVAIERRGWDLIDRLARRYEGTDGFPRVAQMVRVDVDIEIDRVSG